MGKDTNQLKIGSLLSYAQMALSIIIGLIYTPIMIRLLGQSEYGLYNTVSSTISMLSILSLGFNSSYVRYYSKYKKTKNEKAISSLNGLFMVILTIIGIISFACGMFLTNNLHIVFSNGLTNSEYGIAHVLMLLLTINLSISFPMSVFTSIISAHESFIFLKSLGMLRTVVGPMVTLPFLLAGFRSIAMVSVTVVVSIIVDMCYIFFVIVKLKCKFSFRGFEQGLFKSLFVYTIFIAINIIIDQINWNIDKILLGRFCGTKMVAIYAVGYSLYHYYSTFSTSISGVFTPRIHRIVNSCDTIYQRKVELTNLFVKVGRIQFLILSLIASGMIFFGKNFILCIWAGSGYEESYYVALLLIIPSSIALIQNLGIEIQRAQNKHRFRSIAYFFMALINLILSIYLCQIYGAVGSAIGTSISLIVANGIVMNIYYYKRCNLDTKLFWVNILGMMKGLVLPSIFGIALNIFIDTKRIIPFVGCIFIYSAIYVISMWLFAMNDYEKNLIKNSICKLVKRGKNENNKK